MIRRRGVTITHASCTIVNEVGITISSVGNTTEEARIFIIALDIVELFGAEEDVIALAVAIMTIIGVMKIAQLEVCDGVVSLLVVNGGKHLFGAPLHISDNEEVLVTSSHQLQRLALFVDKLLGVSFFIALGQREFIACPDVGAVGGDAKSGGWLIVSERTDDNAPIGPIGFHDEYGVHAHGLELYLSVFHLALHLASTILKVVAVNPSAFSHDIFLHLFEARHLLGFCIVCG